MLDFGDYCLIEQKRHGDNIANERYLHKVINRLRSNSWVPVPVDGADGGRTEVLGEMTDVVSCICCGVDETEVRKYRIEDVTACDAGDKDTASRAGKVLSSFRDRTLESYDCKECGKQFQATQKARYCSTSCVHKAKCERLTARRRRIEQEARDAIT